MYPHWYPWDDYYIREAELALQEDARRDTHPLMLPVSGPYNDLFGRVTYFKGSSVMRMAHNLVSENQFFVSLKRYLVQHEYGSGTTADIWNAFNEATGRNIASSMGPWVYQAGFPFLNVTETADGTTLGIEQHRFMVGGDVTGDEDASIFPVQLGIRTKSGVDYSSMLTERMASFPVAAKNHSDDDFFVLNADHVGFWRTNYPPERLKKLAKQGGTQGILSVSDRSGLILDTAAMAVAGYQKTSSLLMLIDAWKAEESYFVWKAMTDKLTDFTWAWADDAVVLQRIHSMKLNGMAALAHRLGWEFSANEDPIEQLLKTLAFNVAAAAGDPDIVKASQSMFWTFMNGGKGAIPTTIIDAVFAAAVANGGVEEVHFKPQLVLLWHVAQRYVSSRAN